VGEHWVGRVDELPVDRGHVVELNGRRIGLFRVGDEVHAILGTCPHQGGPVGEGGIFPTVEGEIVDGRLRESLNHDRPVVNCPWHGWEFDLATGVCPVDPTKRLRRYETIVRDGEVAVVMPDRDGGR